MCPSIFLLSRIFVELWHGWCGVRIFDMPCYKRTKLTGKEAFLEILSKVKSWQGLAPEAATCSKTVPSILVNLARGWPFLVIVDRRTLANMPGIFELECFQSHLFLLCVGSGLNLLALRRSFLAPVSIRGECNWDKCYHKISHVPRHGDAYFVEVGNKQIKSKQKNISSIKKWYPGECFRAIDLPAPSNTMLLKQVCNAQ